MHSYSVWNIYRVYYWNKLRDKCSSCWSLLHKFQSIFNVSVSHVSVMVLVDSKGQSDPGWSADTLKLPFYHRERARLLSEYYWWPFLCRCISRDANITTSFHQLSRLITHRALSPLSPFTSTTHCSVCYQNTFWTPGIGVLISWKDRTLSVSTSVTTSFEYKVATDPVTRLWSDSDLQHRIQTYSKMKLKEQPIRVSARSKA
jgi:hypothetical protein